MEQYYNKKKHILLVDEAHQSRLDDAETNQFIATVGERLDLYTVTFPDWPPTPRTELQITWGSDDPWMDSPWVGTQFVVDNTWHNRRFVTSTRRDIVPVASHHDPKRVSYQWRIDEYDPLEHVVIRYYLAENGGDIVRWWRLFWDDGVRNRLPEDTVVLVTNPRIQAELLANKGHHPTRRALRKRDMYLMDAFFAGEDGKTVELRDTAPVLPAAPQDVPEVTPSVPEPQKAVLPDTAPAQAPEPVPPVQTAPEPVPPVQTAPEPQVTLVPVPQTVSTPPKNRRRRKWNTCVEGHVAFHSQSVIRAVEQHLNVDHIKFFARGSIDSHVSALTPEGAAKFLQYDGTNRRRYVADKLGRGYDCDDFALSTRSRLVERTGSNAIGIIAGDVHAWNIFVLVNAAGELVIREFEPQTDEWLDEERSDKYSIARRCEVIV